MRVLFNLKKVTPEQAESVSAYFQTLFTGPNLKNIEKLKGMQFQGLAVYRAKLNEEGRVIFCLKEYEGKQCIVLLDWLEHHEYGKAEQWMGQNLSKVEVEEVEFSPEQLKDLVCAPATKPKPYMEFNKETLVLTEKQMEAVSSEFPMIINGPPGSGKTMGLYAVLYTLSKQLAQLAQLAQSSDSSAKPRILYVSRSPGLVRWVEKDCADLDSRVQLDCYTLNELLKQAFPGQRILDFDSIEFEQWLKQALKEKKYDAARKELELAFEQELARIMHHEFSIIAALGVEKYKTLSSRQCGMDGFQALVIKLYEKWQEHVARLNCVDPMLVRDLPNLQRYNAVFFDEAQDSPPSMTKALTQVVTSDQMVVSCDVEQCQHGAAHLHGLICEVLKERFKKLNSIMCQKTMRCPPAVAELANAVLCCKHALAPRDRRLYPIIISERTDRGRRTLCSMDELPRLKKLCDTVDTVIIIPDEAMRDKVSAQFGSVNIMTPAMASGLSFKRVIIVDWFSQKAMRDICKLTPGSGLSIPQQHVLNGIYVAITRAGEEVCFVEGQLERVTSLYETVFGSVDWNLQCSLEVGIKRNTEKDWSELAKKHLDEGHESLADNILRETLKWSESAIKNWKEQHTPKPRYTSATAAAAAAAATTTTTASTLTSAASSAVPKSSIHGLSKSQKKKRKKNSCKDGDQPTVPPTSAFTEQNSSISKKETLNEGGGRLPNLFAINETTKSSFIWTWISNKSSAEEFLITLDNLNHKSPEFLDIMLMRDITLGKNKTLPLIQCLSFTPWGKEWLTKFILASAKANANRYNTLRTYIMEAFKDPQSGRFYRVFIELFHYASENDQNNFHSLYEFYKTLLPGDKFWLFYAVSNYDLTKPRMGTSLCYLVAKQAPFSKLPLKDQLVNTLTLDRASEKYCTTWYTLPPNLINDDRTAAFYLFNNPAFLASLLREDKHCFLHVMAFFITLPSEMFEPRHYRLKDVEYSWSYFELFVSQSIGRQVLIRLIELLYTDGTKTFAHLMYAYLSKQGSKNLEHLTQSPYGLGLLKSCYNYLAPEEQQELIKLLNARQFAPEFNHNTNAIFFNSLINGSAEKQLVMNHSSLQGFINTLRQTNLRAYLKSQTPCIGTLDLAGFEAESLEVLENLISAVKKEKDFPIKEFLICLELLYSKLSNRRLDSTHYLEIAFKELFDKNLSQESLAILVGFCIERMIQRHKICYRVDVTKVTNGGNRTYYRIMVSHFLKNSREDIPNPDLHCVIAVESSEILSVKQYYTWLNQQKAQAPQTSFTEVVIKDYGINKFYQVFYELRYISHPKNCGLETMVFKAIDSYLRRLDEEVEKILQLLPKDLFKAEKPAAASSADNTIPRGSYSPLLYSSATVEQKPPENRGPAPN